MTTKQFEFKLCSNGYNYLYKDNELYMTEKGDYVLLEQKGDVAELLNTFYKENEQLKAQLYYNEEEGVCNICKHHYLVKDDEAELGYYNSRCKKGHYECARISLKHCKDFEKKLIE